MATTKVLLILGAGATGSVFLRNGKAAELLNDLSKLVSPMYDEGNDPPLQKWRGAQAWLTLTVNPSVGGSATSIWQVLTKHLKEEGDGSGGETSALAAQVQRLTQELRHYASASRPITVVNGSSGSTNYGSLVVPVAVVGAVGYGYMWWRGLKWTDFMYVTRKHMTNAVSSVSKQLETVSNALQATKRQLTAKLEGVTSTLNDSVVMQGLIKDQVVDVREEVERATVEIEEVQRLVQGLEVKIDEVQGKQDLTNQGIIFLCRFVSSLEGFNSLSQRSRMLERSASSPQAVTSGAGLKELQYFSEVLATGPPLGKDKVNEVDSSNNVDCTPVVPRGPTLGGKPIPSPTVRRAFSLTRPFGNS